MREILLRKSALVALVDDADYERVNAHRWCLMKRHHGALLYASAHSAGRRLLMHRFVLSAQPGQIVDHRDGFGLNNQRDNLRVCSHRENIRNQRRTKVRPSGFKGVKQERLRFSARITVNNTKIYLGMFDDPSDAARAYDAAARNYHGEFATVNFPQAGERGVSRW